MRRGIVLVTAGVVAAGVAAAVVIWARPDGRTRTLDDAAGVRPAPDPASAAPLAVGPISFFNRSCANCHGDYGSFYGDGFAASRSDAELVRIVREMVVGPARAELQERELGALTAYHRSLADGAPFLALTSRGGAELAGEVTPGSVVRVVGAAAGAAGVRVEGHTWRLMFPEGAGSALPVLRAERGGRGTTLDLSRAAHSHSAGGPGDEAR